jgi:hypothetical protein
MKNRSNTHLQKKFEAQFKIKTQRLILIVLTLLAAAAFTSKSRAESSIDPISQIYFVSDVDQVGPFQLKRTYSSASTFRGHFGTGWCSELDARIRIYAAGEIRYRGCNLETAAAVDARLAATKVQREAFGFRRIREDGVTQVFSRNGLLVRLIRADAEFQILRDDFDRPREIQIRTLKSAIERKISMTIRDGGGSEDVDLTLITSIDRAIFIYKDGMLVKTDKARFSYNDDLNMTLRLCGNVSETIEYDPREDRVTRIARSAMFGRDRLLLAIGRTGKSSEGEIEMKVEVERGAEMHPVRILYNRETRRLSLEGDRDVARLILNWLRA